MTIYILTFPPFIQNRWRGFKVAFAIFGLPSFFIFVCQGFCSFANRVNRYTHPIIHTVSNGGRNRDSKTFQGQT